MSKQNISSIFWDLDGTLINSEFIHDEAIIYACLQANNPITEKDLLKQPGLDSITQFEHLFKQKLTAENKAVYNDWYIATIDYAIEHLHRAEHLTATVELFKYFYKLGLSQSIVSNSNGRIIEHSAELLGIKNYCTNLLSSDDVAKGKPHPDIYLRALSLHGASAENCLVFEDSPSGIKAAKAANLTVVAVAQGEFDPLPDFVCNFDQLNWRSELESSFNFIKV